MRELKYSQDGDVLWVALSDQPIDHAEQRGGIIVNVSSDDELVALEILNASDFVRDALRAMTDVDPSSATPEFSAGLVHDVLETLLTQIKFRAEQAQKRAS